MVRWMFLACDWSVAAILGILLIETKLLQMASAGHDQHLAVVVFTARVK